MLFWFADLMNVTEEVTIHRPNVSTLLSNQTYLPNNKTAKKTKQKNNKKKKRRKKEQSSPLVKGSYWAFQKKILN